MTDPTSPVHVMVDLETMSVAKNAAILSIGAVVFYANGAPQSTDEAATLSLAITPHTYDRPTIRERFDISAATFAWWLQQSQEAQKQLSAGHLQIEDALNALTAFLHAAAGGDPKRLRIWGNGADFDNVILGTAYRSMGTTPLWNFYHNRCYRTLRSLSYSKVLIEPARHGTAHVALDDAKYQAAYALQIAEAFGIDLDTDR
jgi:hypothetical protein